MEYQIGNESCKLALDDNARLTLLDYGWGNLIKTPCFLFHAMVKNGGNWEDEAPGDLQEPEISHDNDTMTITMEELVTKRGKLDIKVVLSILFQSDRFLFSATVENKEPSCLMTDFVYPCIGTIATLDGGKPTLLWPDCTGQEITTITEKDQTFRGTYPGLLSMQWMALTDNDKVLYFSGEDAKFHTSIMSVKSKDKSVTMEMDKLAFAKQGEIWHCPPYVLWGYTGSWRKGADVYRTWCSTWRKQRTQSEWIRRMNGYFLVIHKQQYGDEMWPYGTLEELYGYAKEHGCDTVGMFGWYESGHDNQYPDLKVSDSLGGEKSLKENIKKIQKQGGHVTLYYQGHLLDPSSDFYQKEGWKLVARNLWGTPYYEEYAKSCKSDFLRSFSKKKFATACPSSQEWQDLMASKADWIASFGPDGVLYDQIGGMPPYPCFNKEHHHDEDRPSLSHAPGRIQLLDRINRQVKSHGDSFAFMTEHETDVYSQFPDALHGIGTSPVPRGEKQQFGGALTSQHSSAPWMFRYCFPEVIMTLRNPAPELSPRYVNYALLYGFRFEMEIRYATDQETIRAHLHQDWDLYAQKIAVLRKKHAGLLLMGTYRDQEGYKNGNPAICSSRFEAQGKSVIVLWNDTEEPQQIKLSAKGTMTGWENEEQEGKEIPETLAPGKILLVFLTK